MCFERRKLKGKSRPSMLTGFVNCDCDTAIFAAVANLMAAISGKTFDFTTLQVFSIIFRFPNYLVSCTTSEWTSGFCCCLVLTEVLELRSCSSSSSSSSVLLWRWLGEEEEAFSSGPESEKPGQKKRFPN